MAQLRNSWPAWCGVGLVYVLNKLFPESFTMIFLANIWLFSLPHTFSTFTRQDRRSKKTIAMTIGLFAAFSFGIVFFTKSLGMVLLYSCYFFWQQYHYTKQNYGIARWEKEVYPGTWMDKSFYLLTAFFSILAIFANGPENFFGYVLKNPLPFSITALEGLTINGVLSLAYLSFRPLEYKGALEHVTIFSMAYLFSENFALGWLYLNVFHNLQYLNFMKEFEKKISFIAVPILLTLSLFVAQTYMLMTVGLMLALNFTHYTLDSFIWKKTSSSQGESN